LRVASPGTSKPQKVPVEGDILNWPIMGFNVFDEFEWALSQEKKLVRKKKWPKGLTFSEDCL
jgi:hypothetical protein